MCILSKICKLSTLTLCVCFGIIVYGAMLRTYPILIPLTCKTCLCEIGKGKQTLL